METRGPVTVLDVSFYQGDIDFDTVAEFASDNGIGGVIIKCSERTFTDRKFIDNYNGFGKVGIPRGVYHFGRLRQSTIANQDQAKFFADHCTPDGSRAELGYWGDWEDTSSEAQNLGIYYRRRAIEAFTNTFEAQTSEVLGFYTAKWWWDGYIANSLNGHTSLPIGRMLWTSNPRPQPPPLVPWDWADQGLGDKWTFWQYSFKGEVPGIAAAVDLNTFNGTVTEFKDMFNVTIPLPPPPPPPPVYPPCNYCQRVPTFEDMMQFGTCRGCGAPLYTANLTATIAGLQGEETLRMRSNVWGNPVGYTWNGVKFPVMDFKMDGQTRAWYQLGGKPKGKGIWIASWYANTEIDNE